MIIAQITDFHVRPPGVKAYAGIDTNAMLRRAVAAIAALDPAPDCVLATGDLADCGLMDEYREIDAMLERGVSLARIRYAFNSTNVEGWGLYSEYITKPYMPLEGQLISLDYRLLRAARAFIDPELQSGKLKPEDAYRILEQDVVQSHAMAQQEVERYTYRAPGQANSYFYGYTKLIALRKDVEAALGPKFNAKKFHDFLLSQGLLPPDLMRKAVMEDFLKAQ